MHMTTVDKIKQCGTIEEALLLLAEHIDSLVEHCHRTRSFDQPQPLKWVPFDERAQPLTWVEATPLRDAPNKAEFIEAQLATTQDGDERRALEAKLRLLKDDGGAPEVAPPGRPTQSIQVDDTTTVALPVPSYTQLVDRRQWAASRKLHEFLPLSEVEAEDAFTKGGPMWLYLYDRDAVLSLPVEWRRELVEMIAEDSIPESQEVGRDILKITDSARPEVFGA